MWDLLTIDEWIYKRKLVGSDGLVPVQIVVPTKKVPEVLVAFSSGYSSDHNDNEKKYKMLEENFIRLTNINFIAPCFSMSSCFNNSEIIAC